jgi:hypothetical protein
MPITKKTTSNLTPTPSSEKVEPAQVFDCASLPRRREDCEARTREVLAYAREALAYADDAKAFVRESLRQLSEGMEKLPPEAQSKTSKSVAEGMASRPAEGHRERARSLLQISHNYAQQAAEENDPDRKQRILALSEEFASLAASREEDAEQSIQQALELKQDAAAVSASPSNSDTD